jgi:hypothetical protein
MLDFVATSALHQGSLSAPTDSVVMTFSSAGASRRRRRF